MIWVAEYSASQDSFHVQPRAGGEMIWVAEYSASQDSFHVQPLEDALKANLRRVLVKDPSLAWVIFAWGDEMFVRRVLVKIEKAQARVSLRGSREAS